jgi:hypothetical protein
MSKAEHPLKKLTFVYKKTNNEESIEYFKPKLQNLSSIILYQGGKISNSKLIFLLPQKHSCFYCGLC